jgi:hypothetical protein
MLMDKGKFLVCSKTILSRLRIIVFFLSMTIPFFFGAPSFASEFVHVKAQEIGQGVIWKNGSQCYVISPQHVIKRARNIEITNYHGGKFPAIRFKELAKDAVLLKVNDKKGEYCRTKNPWNTGAKLDELLETFTQGVLKRRDAAGGVDQRTVDIIKFDPTRFIKIRERHVDDIKKGWSGGVLYINGNSAGMLIKVDKGEATVYRQNYLNALLATVVPPEATPINGSKKVVREARFRIQQINEVLSNADELSEKVLSGYKKNSYVKGDLIKDYLHAAQVITVSFELGGIIRVPPLEDADVWIGTSGYGVRHLPNRKGYQYKELVDVTLIQLIEDYWESIQQPVRDISGLKKLFNKLKKASQFTELAILKDWFKRHQASGKYKAKYGRAYKIYELNVDDYGEEMKRIDSWVHKVKIVWEDIKRHRMVSPILGG